MPKYSDQLLWKRLLPPLVALAFGAILSGTAWLSANRYWNYPAEQTELHAPGGSRQSLAHEGRKDNKQLITTFFELGATAGHGSSQTKFLSPSNGVATPLIVENNPARILLILGLVLTGSVALYLHLSGRQRRLHAAMSDLSKANAELKAEIVKHRQVASRLDFSNIVLTATSESSLDGILVVDEEGRIISSNRRFAEMWGISLQTIEARVDEPVLHDVMMRTTNPEQFVARVRHLYAHPDEGAHDRIELKDGRIFERETQALYSRDREYLGRVWFFRDVTERECAEEKIRDDEAKFRIIEKVIAGLYIIAADGTVAYVNQRFVEMFGYTMAEVLGRPFLSFVADGAKEALGQAFAAQMVGEKSSLQIVTALKRKDGGIVDVLDYSSAADYHGKPASIGVILDITERRRIEALLQATEAQLSNALKIARAGHWEYDTQLDRFTFNDNFYRIFRTTVEEAGGYTMTSAEYARRFVHPEDMAIVGVEVKAAIETTDPHYCREFEHRMIYADGSIGYIAVRFFIAKDAQGRTVKTYGVNQDITERKQAAVATEYRAALLHALANAAAELLTASSLEESVPEALRIVGETVRADRVAVLEVQSPDDAAPLPLAFRFGWHSNAAPVRLDPAFFTGSAPPGFDQDPWFAPLHKGLPITNTVSKATGAAKHLLDSLQIKSILVSPMMVDGKYWGQIGFDDCNVEREWTSVEIDILRALSNLVGTAIVRARYIKELADANLIVRNSTAVLFRLSGEPSLPLTYISQNIGMYGYAPADFLTSRHFYMTLVQPEDVAAVQRAMADIMKRNAPPAMIEFRARTADGRTRWVEARYAPVRDAEGRLVEVEGILIDITERKLAEEQITLLARTDPLTGLANRTTFLERLRLAFASAQRGSAAFAILYIDIDRFKDINDTLGHPVGDMLLKTLAERLKASVREIDLVARLGGDEFAVLQTDLNDTADAGELADRIRGAVSQSCNLNGNELHVTVSVGISSYTPNIPGADVLLSHADVALYRAKEEGRDQYRFHSDELDVEVRERVAMADELRQGLDRDEFELYYQPQVEFAGGRIVGMEALIRWHHPRRGLLKPGAFISIAEKTGTVVALGQWVLNRACRQMSEWKKAGIAPQSVAVNVSWNQLTSGLEFVQNVTDTLARWHLVPSDLELDLTESIIAHAMLAKSDVLDRLHRLGTKIAIDDFGSQYSSLDYLKTYRVNRLKVSQNLMEAATRDVRSVATVRAIIGIARELNLEIVAQGVETEQQWSYLAEAIPNAKVQGFYYSKPVTAELAAVLLKRKCIEPAVPVAPKSSRAKRMA